jgi:hypothetical protein
VTSELTAAVARRVTREWAEAFPEFDFWRPLRLARRLGPVVQGITLERSSSGDDYLPTAHVHALTRDFPAVSLTLAWRLRTAAGVGERIRLRHHEVEYRSAARRLREQSPLSLADPPALAEVVEAYRSFIHAAQRDDGRPLAVIEVEDQVLIPAAEGRTDLAEDGLRLAADLARRWTAPPPQQPDPGQWLAGLTERAADRAGLERMVADQVLRHKLTKVRSVWEPAAP